MNSPPSERPFIKSPFHTEVLDLFDTLRLKKKRYGVASCLLLTGESGSGKSELAKHYVKMNPIIEQLERTYIPVLHFELRSVSNVEEFLKSLLIALGDPQMGRGAKNKVELYDRLINLIRTTCVELFILDEIQVIIERRSAQVVVGIADLFKDLIKDTEIPIVFMGMPWSKYLVDSNRQLKRRIAYRRVFPPYRVSNKKDRDDYRRLLKLLANAYGLSSALDISGTAMALRCFAATNGNLSLTAELISEAFMMSEMEDIKVDIELFANVLRSYGVDDEFNSFLVSIDKLVLNELVVNSDWHFGYRANKNAIIDAQFVTYGVSKENKVFCLTG